ncbi:protein O-mannosyl-transferase family [Algivirga pacifica]|uniref:DUF2723 domain-containing protein n=1 Tax=Algivirga pacifica TaxID=1162670 RepID=A0ABP9DBG3_9BACT
MKTFKTFNNLTGWAVFLISLIVYTLTLEETASFWDCGEFIAVSYKLMVPHPPGTPFFQLINRMFSFLALGDTSQVAFWVNFSSAFFSALTIMFLHWTIVLLGMKIIPASSEGYSKGQRFALIGAGLVGALAYTFSDSFWFSAVEAEVYAMSSFLTAFVFWAILKWEHIHTEAASNRWLILIAFVIGLSMGVHLLNLVVLPAMAMIYYYKKYPKGDWKGLVIALGIAGALILILMIGTIQGYPAMTFWFDKLFVNTFGASFGTGGLVFTVLLVAGVVYGIYYSHQQQNPTLNTIFLSIAFILIGYSTYALILIRSNQQTPINENAPDDLLSFVSYLKREQYGDRPLLYGRNFTASPSGSEQGAPEYRQAKRGGNDFYEVYDYKSSQEYDAKDKMLLPRMYSKQPGHDQLYQKWANLAPGEAPKMADNLYYMIRYQIGHMYFRYFMWNFSGRASDYKDAEWVSIFDTLDTEELPSIIENNKGRTNFFMLPLILGLLGFFFQMNKDNKSFLTTLMLFFLTGLALVLYLNSPPVEPRERDYIYVGSFYVFAIWIGFGVLALYDTLGKFLKGASPYAATALGLIIPVVMATQGWASHNRSDRFHSIDQARNTLASCAPNAILFTGGDNDTFPLWYVQNVEGFRTDVRVAVLSYFSTDWYLEQMRQKQYESEPLPLGMDQETYRAGKNEYIPFVGEDNNGAMNTEIYLRLLDKDDQRVQVRLSDGSNTGMLPSKNFYLDIDQQKVLDLGFIPENKKNAVVDRMVWKLRDGKRHIFKNELALLDLIVSNQWERPIYFNNTSANTLSMDLRRYMMMEGMTYRLMPVQTEFDGDVGEVNTDQMLENIKKFQFRELNNPDVYYDEEYRKFGANTRNNFFRLADKLYREDRNEEALMVMDTILHYIPDETIPYSFYAPRYIDLYHRLDEHEKAEEIAKVISDRAVEAIQYVNKTYTADQSIQLMAQRGQMIIRQLAVLYQRREQEIQEQLKIYQAQADKVINSEGSQFQQDVDLLQKQLDIYKANKEKYIKLYEEVAR